MNQNFISIKELKPQEIKEIFDLTARMKADKKGFGQPLKDKTLVLIFQKPSNRTRVSFEVGMTQLGGHTIYLGPEDIKLGVREATKDVAKVLARYADGIVARTFCHKDILEMAGNSSVPVINGLSDLLHPCQAMADIFTIKEKFGRLEGVKAAFVGDGNNVLHSLLFGCSKVGIDLHIATPKGYEPKREIVEEARQEAGKFKGGISFFNKPEEAVKDADVIYTDVWTSMGSEREYKKRLKAFKKYQVNERLVSFAQKGCFIMHCLPAHRGQEITDSVLDGPNSIVLDQAENRLHVQKAILAKLLSA